MSQNNAPSLSWPAEVPAIHAFYRALSGKDVDARIKSAHDGKDAGYSSLMTDTTQPVRIGVLSCGGRMGRSIVAAIASVPDCVLAAASQYPGHPTVGVDVGELAGVGANDILVRDDPLTALKAVDVAIDFGTPAGSERHAALAVAAETPLVIGTTGMTPPQRRKIAEAAETVPIVLAPNMSVGATLLMRLAEQIAALLGPDYDLEVLGLQHRHKVDAPSGTALGLARAAARGRQLDPETIAATPRDGHTGTRPRGLIGIATVQSGDMTGEHTIIAAGDGERIELAHRPSGRAVYAAGAVRAALWLPGKPPGLYGMADVLGLTD